MNQNPVTRDPRDPLPHPVTDPAAGLENNTSTRHPCELIHGELNPLVPGRRISLGFTPLDTGMSMEVMGTS